MSGSHLQKERTWLSGKALAAVVAVVGVLVFGAGAGVGYWLLDDRGADPDASRPVPSPGASSGGGQEGSGGSTGSSAESSGGAGSSASSTGGGRRAALSACADHIAAGEKALRAAKTGVRHWRQHVQARTDMMTHSIGAAQMDKIWKRTRLAGPSDKRSYTAAMKAYEKDRSVCAGLEAVASAGGDMAVAHCKARAIALSVSLDKGAAAMGDWASHLSKMAHFAEGEMTASQAQAEWVRDWAAAPARIKAFERAERRVAASPPCSVP